jgi:hypothetical protein
MSFATTCDVPALLEKLQLRGGLDVTVRPAGACDGAVIQS